MSSGVGPAWMEVLCRSSCEVMGAATEVAWLLGCVIASRENRALFGSVSPTVYTIVRSHVSVQVAPRPIYRCISAGAVPLMHDLGLYAAPSGHSRRASADTQDGNNSRAAMAFDDVVSGGPSTPGKT
jgi:hypothetical protein